VHDRALAGAFVSLCVHGSLRSRSVFFFELFGIAYWHFRAKPRMSRSASAGPASLAVPVVHRGRSAVAVVPSGRGHGAHLTREKTADALTWSNHVSPDPQVAASRQIRWSPTLEDI